MRMMSSAVSRSCGTILPRVSLCRGRGRVRVRVRVGARVRVRVGAGARAGARVGAGARVKVRVRHRSDLVQLGGLRARTTQELGLQLGVVIPAQVREM